MASNKITLENCKSYATEANLEAALRRLGLDNYTEDDGGIPCRYIVARTPDGRWTAIFLASQFFRANKTGGYVGFASEHHFMTV